MASDKALRGKYLFLVTQHAMEKMREKPSKAELEQEIARLEAGVQLVPNEDLFSQTGVLLGRLAGMAYKIIHNFELRDHADRKIARTP